jgi:DNA mismatch repair protein MutL
VTISVLAPDVAAKIAAGEVIERPASIVKELIENALDAGAQRITIEIEAGGAGLIRVSDDGCGLAAEEIPLAFLRHATSKLTRPEDLLEVTTLGFRGEALPSIAAAADVELASRTGSPAGARLQLGPDGERSRGGYGGPRGTVVTVRDLFEQQPARRKFLRSPAAEAGQIATVAGLYAIAYPEVGFTLIADGRRSLVTPGSGSRREAAARIYGAETAAALLEIEAPATDGVQIAGFISPPELTRSHRGHISCFVNRRWVQPHRLAFALEAAFESLLPSGRHPLALLDLRLPGNEIDVNVHPAKSEVRFLNERAVQAAVYHAVRERLLALAPQPAASVSLPVPALAVVGAPAAPVADPPPVWRTLGSAVEQRGPAVTAPGPVPRPAMPILRIVGQAAGLYVVAEGPDGMYLVDQHAAHERVLYERLLAARQAGRPELQGLLSPLPLDLPVRQQAVYQAHAEALRELGFEIEAFGSGAYLLRAVPALLGTKDPARALSELLDDLDNDGDRSERATLATMTLACHAAVRAGKTLAMEEMRELLRSLEDCDLPRTCPHGRPTMIHLSAEALEREFKRR